MTYYLVTYYLVRYYLVRYYLLRYYLVTYYLVRNYMLSKILLIKILLSNILICDILLSKILVSIFKKIKNLNNCVHLYVKKVTKRKVSNSFRRAGNQLERQWPFQLIQNLLCDFGDCCDRSVDSPSLYC